MNPEFETFKTKILSSLGPNCPLQENLRALVVAALTKFKSRSKASLAVHIFNNPEVGELHALVVGSDPKTQEAANEETKRRGQIGGNTCPGAALPRYFLVQTEHAMFPVHPPKDEYLATLDGDLLKLLKKFKEAEQTSLEFRGYSPGAGDSTIIIPLATGRHQRLGFILLCASGDQLKHHFEDSKEQEDRILFRQDIAQLLVTIFTNFYHMAPDTYLPSYYRAEEKCVTLVCAEIRGFDRLSEKLESSGRLADLRSLINKFCETLGGHVEANRGRVDQIWGNGMIAIFGEHLDTPDPHYQKTGFKRALTAAAKFVDQFEAVSKTWIQDVVRSHPISKLDYDHISIRPAVAIDHARVFFDYAGSYNRMIYMAVGDRVNLVKQLAALAGQVTSTARGLDPAELALLRLQNPSNICWEPGFEGAPMLLTQSAHNLADDYLMPMLNQTKKSLHAPHFVNVSGRMHEIPLFGVWSENVSRTQATGSSS